MVEFDVNGVKIYSVEKIKLKKDDILMFVFPCKIHPKVLKNYMDNLPKTLKNKILCVDNSLKVIHIDNEVIEENDTEEDKSDK